MTGHPDHDTDALAAFRKRCSPGGSTYEEIKALEEADRAEWENPPQTALLLTQQEWDDLEYLADCYIRRVADLPSSTRNRRLGLCRRIIEANQ